MVKWSRALIPFPFPYSLPFPCHLGYHPVKRFSFFPVVTVIDSLFFSHCSSFSIELSIVNLVPRALFPGFARKSALGTRLVHYRSYNLFRYIVFSRWSSKSLSAALHIYDHSYTHIIPAIACFLHFVATEDSPKARSSFETKCNAIQRMESMTGDHEGIFVDSTCRNHFSLFLTACEKLGKCATASKK